MSSKAYTLASNVSAAINAITWGGSTISSEVGLAADFNIASITARKIIVCPTAYSRELDTRGDVSCEATVTVAILEKIAPANLDDRIAMVEEIAKAIEKAAMQSGQCMGIEFAPLYDIAQMCASRVFQSVVSVTVKFED